MLCNSDEETPRTPSTSADPDLRDRDRLPTLPPLMLLWHGVAIIAPHGAGRRHVVVGLLSPPLPSCGAGGAAAGTTGSSRGQRH